MTERPRVGWKREIEHVGQAYAARICDYEYLIRIGCRDETILANARKLMVEANEQRIAVFQSQLPHLTRASQEYLFEGLARTYEERWRLLADFDAGGDLMARTLRQRLDDYVNQFVDPDTGELKIPKENGFDY